MESADWEGFVLVSSDTVVGIVGAVILTGAMIAVFYYENSNANGATDDVVGEGDNLYTVTWQEETHAPSDPNPKLSESGTATAGDPVTLNFVIWNYTSVISLELAWPDDQNPAPTNERDTFRVELLDPSGEVVAIEEGDDPTLSIAYTVPATADVAGEPEVKTVSARGDSEEDAELAVKEAAGSVNYQVRVTLVNANDAGSGIPGVGGTVGDTSNAFTLTGGYTHWHAWEETRLPAAE